MSATTEQVTPQGVSPPRSPGRARERVAAPLALALLLVGVILVYLAALILSLPILGTAQLISGRPTVAFAILATAAVAAAARPLHQRTRRLARSLLGVGTTSRYDVLAAFGRRLAALTSTDDALAEVAAITGEALDARRADVWLLSAGEWFLAATCSRADSQPPPRPQDADGHVELRNGQGDSAQVLGAVSVLTANGGPLTTAEAQLLEALAAQAVLVVRAVGLSAERKARLSVISRQKQELRSARLRMLTAADVEQRRLERDLADGPLRHLEAIAAELPRLPARPAMLADLRRHADAAIEGLRDLARGVYPPVLRDSGLVPALEARYRHSAAPVTVHGAIGDGRLPQETELTAYLATCDAVAAALSGAASSITVELTRTTGTLAVTVRDDGEPVDNARRADLQIASDRTVAAGGRFQLEGAPGNGCGSVLWLSLPVRLGRPEP